jgi:hypothetical protein
MERTYDAVCEESIEWSVTVIRNPLMFFLLSNDSFYIFKEIIDAVVDSLAFVLAFAMNGRYARI